MDTASTRIESVTLAMPRRKDPIMNIRTDQSQEEPRLLRRPSDGRILAGVAAGLATYFALNVAHVRIIFIALSFLAGAAVPLYLAAWLLIPAEGSGTAIADEVLNHVGSHLS
jgi:phage shock protein C